MLSRRQKLAAEMLAGGATGRQVAKELSVHETTICNWRKVQEFQTELANRQAQLIHELRSRLLQGSDTAIAALVRLAAQEEDLPSAVQACKCLLTHSKLMPEPFNGLSGADLSTGPVNDMPQGQQDALQQLEQHLDGYSVESDWVHYLSAVDLLNDQDAITALVEDADFLTKTLADFKDWAASQQERGGQ